MILLNKQQLDQRRAFLTEAAYNRDVYLNEFQLFEEAFTRTMEHLTRSTSVPLTIDDYARHLIEQKIPREQIDDKRRHLSLLYEKLDRETRTRYARQYHDLEKRANDFQDRLIAQTIHSEYLLRIWKDYHLRLEDLQRQFEQIDRLLINQEHVVPFAQIQSALILYKDFKQRLATIEPELMHLNDEIDHLGRELNIITLIKDIQHLKEHFRRISQEIIEKYDAHKTATILANDIKRNLAILDDTLGQCSKESITSYDGNANDLKIQLERMMVRVIERIFTEEICLFRIWKNDWIISRMFIQIQ